MMSAGDLNQRVTFQSLQPGRDSMGQPLSAWVNVCTVWANVRVPTGAESIRAGAETATARLSIRIRYRQGLSADMRVLWNGQVYEIKAPPLADRRAGRVDIVAEGLNVSS
jgi:SPP1 family predicted phage head-tail adaptor